MRAWNVRKSRGTGGLSWLVLIVSFLSSVFFVPASFAQATSGAEKPGGGLSASPADAGSPKAPVPTTPALDESPSVLLAPTEAELARGQLIAKIVVVGNRRVPTEDVISYLSATREGKPFTPEGLEKDVRELWRSGFFEDVEVDLSRRDDGVHLRLLVRERPAIKGIEFTGNDKIDSEDLEEALSVEVKPGTILSYASVRRAIQKLRDKYAEEGYFLADASYEVVPQRENEVIVKFTVRENEQVTVRRITFVGNSNVPEEELREVMLTGTSSLFDFGSGGTFRQDAFERDILVLNALYYDRGYLSVQIYTPRVMLTPDRTGIEVAITIDEGPRYRIRKLQVVERDADGKEITPIGGRRALREMIRAKSGDWFNRAELAKDLGSIQTLYRDHGYANVEARPDTQLDPESHEVDVSVAIKRHELAHFGRIEVRGNTKTRDKVIRREMEIEEGQLFNETKLERSKRRITALGYFERVDVTTEQGEDPQHINVIVEIAEKPTGQFQVGAGFSSVESLIATAQIQQANLMGTGQSIALQAQVSPIRQQVDLRFYEPYLLDSEFSASTWLFSQTRAYSQFEQTSRGGSLTFGYPIVQPELRASVTYLLKHDEVSTSSGTSNFFGTASAASTLQRLPLSNLYRDGFTSSVRPTLTYDTRNNQLFPSSGIYLQGSVEIAPSAIGSETDFVQYSAVGRFYYPVTSSVVLKLNTEAGLIASPDREGVPIFARYRLGGILDVRGFVLQSVGPRLPLRQAYDENALPYPEGAIIGGNLKYFQNLELEFPLIEAVNIRGVVFTDLGNTWNLEPTYCEAAASSPYEVTNPCFSFSSLANVRTSWGFGVRWFSPLGPLRFEWGFPFKPLPYEEKSDFEFTIANFF